MLEDDASPFASDQASLSLPEEVQLVLQTRPGKLEFAWTQLAAAALADLALEGRIGSVPNRALFTGGKSRLLTVLSDAPLSSPILDVALRLVNARTKPWIPYKCVLNIGREVSLATHSELVRKGIVTVVGDAAKPKGYLQVENVALPDQVKAKLDRARLQPDEVSDPRVAALVDVVQNAGNLFIGDSGLWTRMMREWYPPLVRDTVDAILEGEALVSQSQ